MTYDLSELSVLVVDDDVFVLKMMRSLLNGFGIVNVRTVGNSVMALSELEADGADIIFVDWDMSPENGIEFTKMLRLGDYSPDRYVPIIIMTGHTERSLVLSARDAGVNEFLAKPMTVRSLYQRIMSVIERPRPFVRSPDYFGPDRRRVTDPNYKGPDRRASSDELVDI